MRVYEFAKELNKDSGDLLEELNGNFGFEIKSHLSGINEEQMEEVRLAYSHKKDLSIQIEDSHTKDLEEKFNTGVGICADAEQETILVEDQIIKMKPDLSPTSYDNREKLKNIEPETKKDGEWTLGSGDTIPPEITLDEKAIKELKEENEKAVKISMESAEKARQEYKKTVENIVENPDDWSNTMNQVRETQSWWEKLLLWIKK